MSDGGRPPATGLQEQVANHRKRRGSKARVVSVTEKAPRGVRWETGRRTPVNCRSSVESTRMTSKPAGDVTPGSVWTIPAYGPDGVRHRGSAILFQALTLNCGNLRWRWQAKGTSPQGEADSSDAPPRGGTARSSVETAVMAEERRGGAIRQAWGSTGQPGGIPHDLQAVPVHRLDGGSRMSREVHVRLCVQKRLACSAGDRPAGVEVRAP